MLKLLPAIVFVIYIDIFLDEFLKEKLKSTMFYLTRLI